MNKKQKSAVLCALADLIGSAQAHMQDDIYAHDWSGHMDSIRELAEVFPTLCCNFADTIDKLEKDREAIGQ